MGRVTKFNGYKSRGHRNIAWIERNCIVPEGKYVGEKVKLDKFQKEIILGIYNNSAITRQAIISFARKNAKTTLCAFILLLHLVGPEAKRNSQLYSSAQSREQAALVYNLAVKMVHMNDKFDRAIGLRENKKEMYCTRLGTEYKALSSEAKTAFGMSPALIIHDELGQVVGPRSPLYEALESACAAQEEPLSIVISTQAPNDNDLLSILIDDALKGDDPTTVLFLYTADEELDPFSIEAMKQANPAFETFMNKGELKNSAKKAKRMPSMEAGYRNLNLNQRCSQEQIFVSRTQWNNCNGKVNRKVFAKFPCYAALDLSAKNDLTALTYSAKDEEGYWHTETEFYTPLGTLKERSQRDRAPYDLWVQKGLMNAIAGKSIEYDVIARRLIELHLELEFVSIAFDRWRIDILKKELLRLVEDEVEGAEEVSEMLEPFGQGYKDMGPAMDEVETIIINEKLKHGDHPVLKWCASNAIVTKDPAGSRKLDKSKASGRIDGLVSMVMSIGNAVKVKEEPKSVYEERGIRSV